MALTIRALILAALVLGSGLQLWAGTTTAADRAGNPGVDCTLFPERGARGQEAIDLLGSRLGEVAARNGMAAERLLEQLSTDDTVWLDRCGQVYFVDPEAAAPTAAPSAPTAAPFPLDRTFKLHSRVGAKRVIYLDFNGERIANTGWNDSFTGGAAFTTPAYNFEGSATTFSAAEQAVIQNVWREVSEDFAPFAIDVTTEDPGIAAIERSSSGDQYYGTRAVITTTNPVDAACGCGGIAYLGVFNDTWDHGYYQPAFAFTQNSWGMETSAKSITAIVSHEVGHNLGLEHDGTSSMGYYPGHGSWAPIMGVSYDYPISQWSKGEYPGANNKQNDFKVMQAHGALLRPDDHKNTLAEATILPTKKAQTVQGRITTAADIDWFAFTGSGVTKFTAKPAPMGPNLDIRLRIYNSAGTLIKQVSPASGTISFDVASGLDAVTTMTLPSAGTYYVSVAGVGNGNLTTGYSDYGSVGTYKLTITTVVP